MLDEDCLDNDIFASLQFYDKNISEKCDSNTDLTVLKQSDYLIQEISGYPYTIMLGIKLEVDSLKHRTVVTSYDFLTLLGDIGGTVGIFLSFLSFFGIKFSELSYTTAQVESNFMQRNR